MTAIDSLSSGLPYTPDIDINPSPTADTRIPLLPSVRCSMAPPSTFGNPAHCAGCLPPHLYPHLYIVVLVAPHDGPRARRAVQEHALRVLVQLGALGLVGLLQPAVGEFVEL